MIIEENQLANLLIAGKIVPEKELSSLLAFARSSDISLQEAIIEKGLISEHKLGILIAALLKVPFIELSKIIIPEDVFNIIPEGFARKHKIIAFAQDDKNIKLGMVDPNNEKIIEAISKKTSKKALVHLTTESEINSALQMYQDNLQDKIDELVKDEIGNINTLTNDAPLIKIVSAIITAAYRNKASDIHIEPDEENLLVRFRIDGILHRVLTVDKSFHPSIITRIKVLARLRTDEHLDAQDGKMRIKIDDEDIDIRVSIIPTTEGEKVVLRLLSSKFRSFSLSDLGMNKRDLTKVNEAISKSYGMVLSTGPTGSGKTTSIYALLKILNTPEKNITTIEDPVEYRIKGVNHIPVNAKTSLTFVNGLRSILRQDPNIIFVGEIRDQETAGLAVNAALTGHLLFSTLHTNDAATALVRLIDMKIEPFLLASTVNVILAQRLIRKICTVCKAEMSIKRGMLSKDIPPKISEKYFGKKAKIKIYKGTGCKVCHFTGYTGRIGIFEVLEITEKIRDLILERKDSGAIREAAIFEGMTTLLDDGLRKVSEGITTLDEIMRVIKVERV